MSYLLFVDDDSNLLSINRDYFTAHGHHVVTCDSAEQALLHVQNHVVDCVVLDIVMPETDGFSLCRDLKSRISAPVIFLTSMTEKEYLYQGFSLGGDDFLTKPCDLRELELRINTRISQRRNALGKGEQLSFPPLLIDVGMRHILIEGEEAPFTSIEFDILLLLARSPGHVFSPDTIYREVWKLPDLNSTQTVKVHMARMRHKLEEACPEHRFIGTAWKQGYYFDRRRM